MPKSLADLARRTDWAPLFIRIPAGFHLIHGTQDNVFSWAQMLEFRDFLGHHGFPFPLICAVVSVAAQFICGALYLVGYRTREAALVMIINFAVALLGFHVAQGHGYPAMFPAIAMWTMSAYLLFAGAGRFSIDARLNRAAAS